MPKGEGGLENTGVQDCKFKASVIRLQLGREGQGLGSRVTVQF